MCITSYSVGCLNGESIGRGGFLESFNSLIESVGKILILALGDKRPYVR